jgi:hypothetical protein
MDITLRGCVIAEVVSPRLPTVAAQVRAQVRSYGGQGGTGTGSLQVLQFLLPIIPQSSSLSLIWDWYNNSHSSFH